MSTYDWASLLDDTPTPPRRTARHAPQDPLARKAADFQQRRLIHPAERAAETEWRSDDAMHYSDAAPH